MIEFEWSEDNLVAKSDATMTVAHPRKEMHCKTRENRCLKNLTCNPSFPSRQVYHLYFATIFIQLIFFRRETPAKTSLSIRKTRFHNQHLAPENIHQLPGYPYCQRLIIIASRPFG